MAKDIDINAIAATFLDSLESKRGQEEQLEAIRNLVQFLAAHNMLSHAGKLVEAVRNEAARRGGTLSAALESAGNLSPTDIENVKKMVGNIVGGDVQHNTNKGLLGGLKMKIADKVVDATIRRKLDQLSKDITE